MTGPLTRPIVAFTKATSSSVVLRPYCAAIHSYPSACRGTISLLKHEPSAQSPWQNTMLGLVCVGFILFSFHTLGLRQNQRSKTGFSHRMLKAGCSLAGFCWFCCLSPKNKSQLLTGGVTVLET